ncbi:MAG: hypothetical protein KAT05_16130, partial [Spirochaetes bacterium]|nr:hypothetical protein [Spirochaetota bacterium]
MSLLEKALQYREKYLNKNIIDSSIGLLNRALSYLGLKKTNQRESSITVKPEDSIKLSDENETTKLETDTIFNKIQTIGPLNEKDTHIDQSSKYYSIINDISNDMSALLLENDAHIKFNDIITQHFKFIKNVLLIYSPSQQKFIYWY